MAMTRRGFLKASALGLVAAPAVLSACSPGEGPSGMAAPSGGAAADDSMASMTTFAFDTVLTFRARCDQSLLDTLDERCRYFERIFSRTIETSDIGRINQAKGAPVEVAPETAELVSLALGYCEQSQGRFDITIGAVSSLWDFKAGVVPADADIKAALPHVDYTRVHVDGTTVTLEDARAMLDLGGIAKGYIADDLCRILAEAGCESAFVNLGGNVKTLGTKPDGSPWRVGIQDPAGEVGDAVAAVDSAGTSVVTSGLYERVFESGGKRYWHILDSATGYPVQSEVESATIVSDASIDGDGYTKPLFMMSFDEALAWVESKPGIEGLLMGGGRTAQSSGMGATLL